MPGSHPEYKFCTMSYLSNPLGLFLEGFLNMLNIGNRVICKTPIMLNTNPPTCPPVSIINPPVMHKVIPIEDKNICKLKSVNCLSLIGFLLKYSLPAFQNSVYL